MSRRTRKPTFKFGPSSSLDGFTSYDTASFNDVEPARIIRELIQNSLDAAVEAGEGTAIVQFRVKSISRSEVPDLRGYERAFKRAVSFHRDVNDGHLPDTSQQVVDDIESGLRKVKRGMHHSLSVIDNGIGLDNRRMHSILGNGASAKTDGTGSYGVGHLAAISTSDLRYVLYGAVQPNGHRIAAGHAVLASSPGEDSPRAAGGYLVRRLLNGSDGRFYEFLTARDIPEVLISVIDDIESEWGHGTAVVIPSFNHFRERPRRLWEIVSTVASRNFNAAIAEGNLVVEVDDRDVAQTNINIHRLNSESLKILLESQKENQRAPRAGSLFSGLRITGHVAHMTYLALSEGQSLTVNTESGDVDIHLLTPSPNGRTRVDLYRNGMWVTRQIPGLEGPDFTDLEPFYGVVKLTRDSGEFHRLVRKAEGPMHDKLDLKRLTSEEKSHLESALKQVSEQIRAVVPELSTEGYLVDDYLIVDTGDEGTDGGPKSFSVWGSPEIVQRRSRATVILEDENGGGGGTTNGNGGGGDGNGEGDGDGDENNDGRRHRRRSTPPLEFSSTAVPDGQGNCTITLTSSRPLEDVVLSLRVDENADATCDRIGPDEDVRLTSVTVADGASPSQDPSIFGEGSGIRLQGLDAGINYEVNVSYQVPQGLQASVESPVFRVELRRLQRSERRS